jgi:hypothetical protein
MLFLSWRYFHLIQKEIVQWNISDSNAQKVTMQQTPPSAWIFAIACHSCKASYTAGSEIWIGILFVTRQAIKPGTLRLLSELFSTCTIIGG